MKTVTKLALLMSVLFITSCKEQEIDVPESESNINFTIKDGSEKVNRVIPTSEGGFAYAGSVGGDAFVYVVDQDGNNLWYKAVGGDKQDVFYNIVQTSDGDFIAVGYTYSNDLGVKNDFSDGYAVRFSRDGNVKWYHIYGWDENDGLSCIREDPDGNFAVGGYHHPSSSNSWITRMDGDGNFLWSYTYEIGPWHDLVKDITFTSSGDYVVWGMESPNGNVQDIRKYLTYRAVFSKFDGSYKPGTYTVYEQYERLERIGNLLEHSFRVLQVGNDIYWINNFIDISGEEYTLFVKVDQNGNVLYDKKLFRERGFDFRDVTAGTDNGVFIMGSIGDFNTGEVVQNLQSALLKLNQDGAVEWEQTYGGSLGYQALHSCNTRDNHITLAGFLSSAQTGRGMFMNFKTDLNGDISK